MNLEKENKIKMLMKKAEELKLENYDVVPADEILLCFESFLKSKTLNKIHNGFVSNIHANKDNFLLAFKTNNQIYTIINSKESRLIYKEGDDKIDMKKSYPAYIFEYGFIIDKVKKKKIETDKIYYL